MKRIVSIALALCVAAAAAVTLEYRPPTPPLFPK